ncbi:hypothetical protein FB446DRAFT_719885 [Lentinula raphanica]|nr:hypothetical protein FB446DRAFT_719885 [Lentinula raphanica]
MVKILAGVVILIGITSILTAPIHEGPSHKPVESTVDGLKSGTLSTSTLCLHSATEKDDGNQMLQGDISDLELKMIKSRLWPVTDPYGLSTYLSWPKRAFEVMCKEIERKFESEGWESKMVKERARQRIKEWQAKPDEKETKVVLLFWFDWLVALGHLSYINGQRREVKLHPARMGPTGDPVSKGVYEDYTMLQNLIKGGVKSEVQGKDHLESGKNSQAQTQCVPESNKAESDAPSQSSSADEDWEIVGGDSPKSGKPEGRS